MCNLISCVYFMDLLVNNNFMINIIGKVKRYITIF